MRSTLLARSAIVFVCLVVAAAAVVHADHYDHPPSRQTFATFPMQINSWHGVQDPPLDANTLAVLGVDDYITRAYFRSDRAGVGLYIGYWDSQRQGSTIHSPLNCLPGSGWEPVSAARLDLPDARAGSLPPIRVNRYIVQKGVDRQLVLYWYQSHGRIVASEYWSRFFLVADAVRLRRSDGAIVRVTVPLAGEGRDAEQAAERAGVAFVADLLPKLEPFLPS